MSPNPEKGHNPEKSQNTAEGPNPEEGQKIPIGGRSGKFNR